MSAHISKIHGDNFCCLKEFSLDLERQGLVLITGENRDTKAASSNGSGKSTIGKALTWCLFGETLDGDKFDQVIRKGAKRATVEVEIKDGSHTWMVRRSREIGSPSLSLFETDYVTLGGEKVYRETLIEGTSKEVQEKIIDILNQNFRVFCNTRLFGQGDINRFFSSNHVARNETLNRILGNDIYGLVLKYLRESLIAPLKSEITDNKNRISNLESGLAEIDIESVSKFSSEWSEDIGQRIERMLSEAKDLMLECKVQKSSYLESKNKLTQQLKSIPQIDMLTIHAPEEKIAKELRKAQHRLQLLNDDLVTHRAEYKSVVDKLDRLSDDRCPTCNSDLRAGEGADYKEGLAERRDILEEKAKSIKEEKLKSELKIRAIEERLQEAKDTRMHLIEQSKEADRLRERLHILESQYKNIFVAKKAQAKQKLEIAHDLETQENPYEKQLVEMKRRAKQLKQDIEFANQQLKSNQERLDYYNYWSRGFGYQGIPSLLLDSTMPYLTERANHYLRILTDGDITVSFSTQKELKSRDAKKEEINISCCIEGLDGVTPSNGQKRKLEIAVDLALMDLVGFAGGQPEFIIIDEILDGLDSEGVSRVMKLLKDLRGWHPSIFVISHESSLAEIFEKSIQIVKENGESRIL